MPNFLANSYFPASLLEYIDASVVGTHYAKAPMRQRSEAGSTSDQATKSLYVAASDDSVRRLSGLLADPGRPGVPKQVREDVRVFESISLPEEGDRLSNPEELISEELDLWEAVLHPITASEGPRSFPADQEILQKWIALVSRNGGFVEEAWIRVSGGMTFVPTRLAHNEAASTLAAFNPLRSLHPMPRLRTQETASRDPQLIPPRPSTQTVPKSALRVAVFDGGCDEASPYYKERVRNLVVGNIIDLPGVFRHGTLVTSALLYGHAPRDPLIPASMLIDHYQVVPDQSQPAGMEMYWLLDVISDILVRENYQVVSLSVGPSMPTDNDYVDRWTCELDRIAHDNDVLFVVAAGNQGHSSIDELRRIQVPGDMVNGLTVGACDDGVKAQRAGYSSTGPGRAGARIQPAGVAFGGTESVPFEGLDADGAALHDQGTSFAAPLVVHGLADLVDCIGNGSVSAVDLRAFAVHFAEPCARSPLTEVGHGRFRTSYREVLFCAENTVHVLYRGSISRDEFVPLAVPLPDNTPGRIRMRWTLATSVAVEPTNAVEYVKAGLEIVFRPHANKRSFARKGAKRLLVDVHEEEARAAELISDGYTPSQEPASETPTVRGKNEAALREEGKWETIRVSDQGFKEGRLFRPRLDLSHIAREGGALARSTPDLNYALLVTLRAQPGTPLYDQVRTNFPVLVPVAVPIGVSTHGSPGAS